MNSPERNLAWLAKHHFGKLRVACFIACLSPALWLGAEWLTGRLGVNPLNRLLHFTGRWALIMLIVTLSVTPVRRLSVRVSQVMRARYGKRVSDWNWLIRLRRQFGLFSFFYICTHLSLYVGLDVGADLAAIRDDVLDRPFILAGFTAFVLLAPLAATSTNAAMRWLGKAWKKLHMLSYVAALLAIAHYWMQAKVGDFSALPYSAVLGVLLGARVMAWWQGDRSAGEEVKER